ATATSSVKSASLCSASSKSRTVLDATATAPQRRELTVIGQTTSERILCSRNSSPSLVPGGGGADSSYRDSSPVWNTLPIGPSGPSFQDAPVMSSEKQTPATTVAVPSGSKRTIMATSAPPGSKLRSSSATAAKTSAGVAEWATRVATRRR